MASNSLQPTRLTEPFRVNWSLTAQRAPTLAIQGRVILA
jgi:hypothetical protein